MASRHKGTIEVVFDIDYDEQQPHERLEGAVRLLEADGFIVSEVLSRQTVVLPQGAEVA